MGASSEAVASPPASRVLFDQYQDAILDLENCGCAAT